MGNIVFHKLLETAADPNVPLEVIEETVHTALKTPAFMREFDVLNVFKTFDKQAVCNFFKEFVKRGIDYVRYYELIYTMLTYQIKDNFQLGFAMSEQNGFNDKFWLNYLRRCRSNLKVIPFIKMTRMWIAGFAFPF